MKTQEITYSKKNTKDSVCRINSNDTALFENIWNSRLEGSREKTALRILKQPYKKIHCKSLKV